jgi:pyruvate/2-oxoglutarate dehydrogenase complex dihydrolipoamide dehydrogenase (E3) component
MTLRAARESKRELLVGTQPMKDVGRAREKGETEGFMRIVVDAKTKEILGASLLGVGCDEVVHAVLDVMYAKAPYTTVARAMHIHPTVAEYLPTVLQSMKPPSS